MKIRTLLVAISVAALTATGASGCGSSSRAVPTTVNDPELAALVANPVGWWQQRQDTIDDAICRSDRQALLDEVSAASTNLAAFENAFGTCPHVTVTAVEGMNGATTADAFRLGTELHFYVTDSGWSGPNHQWSAHFVREDGHWKLLNNK